MAVLSMHKALPCMRQGAVLLSAAGVDRRALRENTMLFGTSSPSYPIMASIDLARAYTEGPGHAEYRRSAETCAELRAYVQHRTMFTALTEDHFPALDPCRLTVCTAGTDITGHQLADTLWSECGVACEMADDRNVVFILTGSEPSVECTLVPVMAVAVAEQFALAGKRVLVLLTDMTNYADAQKEMAITMEQVPSNRGYPGDLYSCLAARYEKAVDFEGAGSITILGVTTMPGDDVTHPVPDNTGYITAGQYYQKSGHLAPFGSLSRLKQNVNDKTRSDHRAQMDGMIRLYSAYKESLEKKSMGFMMSEWDEKLLKYGHLFETKLMDLSVNIPLEEALDLGWEILAECFEPNETGLKTSLIQERWPKRSAVE